MSSIVLRRPSSLFFSRDFSDVLDGLFSSPRSHCAAVVPPMDLWEDEDNYYVELEIPGYRMEDLEISVAGTELNVTGKLGDEAVEGGDKLYYHRRERGPRSSFARSVELPGLLQLDSVEAALKDGVLKVALPKAQETKPKRVEIKLS